MDLPIFYFSIAGIVKFLNSVHFFEKSLDFFLLFFVLSMKNEVIYEKTKVRSGDRGLVGCLF